jgi:hypothetical protein
VYYEIAQDTATKAIIELPLQKNAWDYPRRMYFAAIDGKSILQGYTSRPEANPLPPDNMPGVRQVLYNSMQPDISYTDSKAAARAFFDFYGLGYLVIDNNEAGNKTLVNTPKILDQLFADNSVENWQADAITSYKIPLQPTDQTLTTPLVVPGANWNTVEKNDTGPYRWLGSTGRLLTLIPAGGGQNLKLSLQGAAFVKPRTLSLQDDNGHELARLTVGNESKVYESNTFNLPAGENWLNLVSLDGTDTPASVAPAGHPTTDQRPLSVLVYKLSIK